MRCPPAVGRVENVSLIEGASKEKSDGTQHDD